MKHANTKNNHYVPRFYLKYFASAGYIYAYIIGKGKIKVFNSHNLNNVSSLKNLYTLHTDKVDMSLIRSGHYLINEEALNCSLDEIIYYELTCFLSDRMSESILLTASTSHRNYQIIEFLKAHADGAGAARNAELLLGHYESKAKAIIDKIIDNQAAAPILKKIADERGTATKFFLYDDIVDVMYKNLFIHLKDLFESNKGAYPSFLEPDKLDEESRNYIYLLYYIVLQLLRNPKAIKVYENERHEPLPDTVRFGWLLQMFYQGIHIAAKCAFQNYKFIIINNDSNLDFITSDVPVVNTYSYMPYEEMSEADFLLYYPISSRHALYVTNCEKIVQNDALQFDEQNVHQHNMLIYKHALKFVFAAQQDTLNKYII